MSSKTLPLALVVPVSSGSDLDVIEVIDTEDRSIPSQVYGESPGFDDFDKIDPCTVNPAGHHVYSREYFNWRKCKFCGSED